MSKKFPWGASLVCFSAILFLSYLGFWQLERLTWKTNLQSALDAAFTGQAVELNLTDIKRGDIRRGFINGTPDMSKAIILHGRIDNGRAIDSLVVPFQTNKMILPVEIGCSETIKLSDFTSIKSGESIQIQGVVRVPTWSYFAPHNSPDKGDWWRLDSIQLAEHWGHQSVAPLKMTLEDVTVVAGNILNACPIQKQLRNDHMSYALFWFSMAIVLMMIWALRFLRPYLQSA